MARTIFAAAVIIGGFALAGTKTSNVILKLSLAKAQFLAGEDISLTVSITNDGSAPQEIPNPFHSQNWQPVYTLTGPWDERKRSFSFRSAVIKDLRPAPGDVPLVLTQLAAGQELRKDIPLHEWAQLTAPGTYTVQAKLIWRGMEVESNVATFDIEQPMVKSMSVGIDDRDANAMGEWADWLHNGRKGAAVFTSLFQRPHVDVRGYEPFSITSIYMAGSQATDVLVPWTNYNRQAALAKWQAWREGSSLFGLVTSFKEAQRLELGAVPHLLVRPAIMLNNGQMDVFAVNEQGSELMCAHFPPPNWKGAQNPPQILWRTRLPFAAECGRAAISPRNIGNEMHVIVVGHENGELKVAHMNVLGGQSGSWSVTDVAAGNTIANTEPGFQIDREGGIHVAFPFENQTGEVVIADLRLTKEGKLVHAVELTPVGKLPSAPKASAASYVITADGPPRRDWAILLDNGSVIHSFNAHVPQQLRGAPAMPLELISLTSAGYLLVAGKSGNPEFEYLH